MHFKNIFLGFCFLSTALVIAMPVPAGGSTTLGSQTSGQSNTHTEVKGDPSKTEDDSGSESDASTIRPEAQNSRTSQASASEGKATGTANNNGEDPPLPPAPKSRLNVKIPPPIMTNGQTPKYGVENIS